MALTHGEKPLIPITLRIPEEIHGRLKKISEAEYRSLNHQVIMALTYFVEMHEKGKAYPGWLKTPVPAAKSGPR